MPEAKVVCECDKLLTVERRTVIVTTSATPNSEYTLSSFGITSVAELELTTFTTGYLEQSLVIRRRYSLLGISAKSTHTVTSGVALL